MCSDQDDFQVPPRTPQTHKGSFGHLLIVAGSRTMSGAARLSGLGGLRSGVGLLTLACPDEVWPLVAAANPAWMTIPLPTVAGSMGRHAEAAIKAQWERKTALAIGPGLGIGDDVRELVYTLVRDCPVPLVLDADGLNAFAGQTQRLKTTRDQPTRILTPHPGELARLMQRSTAEIQADRVMHATDFARRHSVIVVLKGNQTIITDGERLATNSTGNAGLARGGSGDVLTGLIGGLLAQPIDPFEAARLGTYLHGLAGDLAAESQTPEAMFVTELVDHLPAAWRNLKQSGRIRYPDR